MRKELIEYLPPWAKDFILLAFCYNLYCWSHAIGGALLARLFLTLRAIPGIGWLAVPWVSFLAVCLLGLLYETWQWRQEMKIIGQLIFTRKKVYDSLGDLIAEVSTAALVCFTWCA